jgi:hypothetical protein
MGLARDTRPMDWFMTSDAETAARIDLSLPCGFGTDYAGDSQQRLAFARRVRALPRRIGGVSLQGLPTR